MKKKITWILSILLVAMLTVPVFAAGTVKATASADVSSLSGGDTVTVTVSAEVDQCGNGGVEISFDTKIFELVSGEWLLEGTFIDDFDTSSKDGVFMFEDDSAISGPVFRFVLKVKDSAALGTSRVNIKFTADKKSASTNISIAVVCPHAYADDCDTSCDLCGATREVTHSWDSGTVTTEPTCTGEGVKTYTCTRCGKTKTESVKAKDHTYDKGIVTTEPTCTDEGVKTYTCTACGKTKTEAVKATGHDYDKGKVTTEPTCTDEGVRTYTCAACGKTKTEAVESTGHSYDEGTVTTEPTCTEEGVKTVTCTACGKTKTKSIEATGHSYDKGTVTEEATCTGEGVKTYTCTACGKTKTSSIESKGHSYDDGVVTQEATCTSEGKLTYTCTVCGKVKNETIDQLEHLFDSDCDETCNTCDLTREVNHEYISTGDSDSHWQECTLCQDIQALEAHACETEMTSDDTQHGYICTVCGMLAGGEPHVFDNECDTTCDLCGYTRSITHYYSTRWTYSAEGHWYECTVCGDQLEMELHIPGEEATENTDQICLDCGYIIQIAGNHQHTMAGDWLCDEDGHWFQCGCLEYTDPAPHIWDQGVIDQENMLVVYTCTDCGYSMTETYIPPTLPPETQPQQSAGNTVPGDSQPPTSSIEDPSWLDFDFNFNFGFDFRLELWMILAVCLAVSLGFNAFLLKCLFAKKKTGKYAKAEEPADEEPEDQDDEE